MIRRLRTVVVARTRILLWQIVYCTELYGGRFFPRDETKRPTTSKYILRWTRAIPSVFDGATLVVPRAVIAATPWVCAAPFDPSLLVCLTGNNYNMVGTS